MDPTMLTSVVLLARDGALGDDEAPGRSPRRLHPARRTVARWLRSLALAIEPPAVRETCTTAVA